MAELKEVYSTLVRLNGELPDGAEILDVGCGTKPYQRAFPNKVYFGIDIAESGRPSDTKKPDAYYDGVNIPFPDGKFSLVMLTEVLEHVEHPRKLLKEIQRVLKPGGLLFISVPFAWGEHEMPYDFRRFTSVGLAAFIQHCGFELVRSEKSVRGIEAIKNLVGSEINASKDTSRQLRTKIFRLVELPGLVLWRFLCWYWGKLYQFPRIYIRNIAVARKITS